METNYSVLMSVYIKEDPGYLKLSIDSMLNQTIYPEQIILVEDGPLTDELYNVISAYKVQYPETFTIVKLKENLGLGLALNAGIKASRNELIARMDTDDISYEDRCQKQLIAFDENPDIQIIGTYTSEFYDTPNKIVSSRVVPIKHKDIIRFSKRRSPFNHPTVMYKKKAVLAVGGYNDVLRNEDIDLFVRMLNNDSKGMNLREPLLFFRSNEANFHRRKSWVNCKNYIAVIYGFWRKGYSSLGDLIFVVITQIGMFLAPTWLLKNVSNSILRKKVKVR